MEKQPEKTPHEHVPPVIASPATLSCPSHRWVSVLALLLVFMLSLYVGYASLHTLQLNQQLSQQIKTLTVRQHLLQLRLQKSVTLRKHPVSFVTPCNIAQTQWVIARVRALLELADINTHWSYDPQTSVILLKQADTLLQPLPFASLFPIRQAIAQEISTLNALTPTDTAGILSQLDAAQTRAASLPLATFPSLSQTAAKLPHTNSWHAFVTESLKVLKTLVVVQHHEDNPIQPLLSSLDIRAKLLLQLQIAQWAVIHRDNDVYQQALKQAIKACNLLALRSLATQSLRDTLNGLLNIPMDRAVIRQGKALMLLNQWHEEKTPSALGGENLP